MKPLEYKKNPQKGECYILRCRNKPKGGRKLCSTCSSRKTRLEDPVKYAFITKKNHAKEKGILFTITLPQWRDWCSKVEYVGFTGHTRESYDCDRRYNDIGYHIDNIQVLKKVDNIKKYFYYDYRTKAVRFERAEPKTDGPF